MIGPATRRAQYTTTARLAGVALPASIGATGLLLVGARLGSKPYGHLLYAGLLLQLGGCLLLGIAMAAVTRLFIPAPGDLASGMVVGLLTTLAIYNPLSRGVDIFPISERNRWSSAVIVWTIICALCLLTLARTTRDPLD